MAEIRNDDYSEAYAEAKLCQDIVLKAVDFKNAIYPLFQLSQTSRSAVGNIPE